MVSPVLGQAMRTPEQLPALEETKARGPIPRMSRATMSVESLSCPFYGEKDTSPCSWSLDHTTFHKANCL